MSPFAPRYLAIMQGRLVPPPPGRFQCFPRDGWEQEFASAKEAQLDAIEWIWDLYGADVNPLGTDAGLERLRRLSGESGVRVVSVCADAFMEEPLVRAKPAQLEERLEALRALLRRCSRLEIERIVVPFVDASKITGEAEMDDVARTLARVVPTLEETKVELHLETSLGPRDFAAFLGRLPHPLVKVNYDSGNSSSLGYAPREEFAAYGRRVGSVHIKDRVLGGGTVPLGEGSADFTTLREALGAVAYRGDLVLQVARGAPGDEVAWARGNRAFVRGWLEGA
jgi:hexulose-6-phosphate isomerase